MVRALEEAKLGFGARDGHVAAAHNNLAEVYRKMRQFERAEQLYLEVGACLCAIGREEQFHECAYFGTIHGFNILRSIPSWNKGFLLIRALVSSRRKSFLIMKKLSNFVAIFLHTIYADKEIEAQTLPIGLSWITNIS